LTAYADSTHVQLHADAHGRNDSRITIDAQGAPRKDGGKFVALAASIEKLRVSAHGRTWDVVEPCALDIGSASRITIAHCRIGSGRAEIGIKGSAPLTPTAAPGIDMTLSTRHLNLRDLGDLAAPGHKQQPRTDFDIAAQVTGTMKAPIVDFAVSGKGAQVDEGIPENVNYNVRAHYENQRVHGSASMRQVGLSLGVGARFDVPITLDGPDQPISLELVARPVPFFKIRSSLPPAIANLKGFFTLRLSAQGTTHHPRVRGEIHAPSWQLDDLGDNDTVVDFVYGDGWLKVNSETSFNATSLIGAILRIQPQRNSGTVSVELHAPLDLYALVTSPHQAIHALVHDVPLTASAELRRLDLTKVPLQTIGIAAPLNGTFDGSLRLEGTLHRPRFNAELKAKGLTRVGSFDHADLKTSLQLADGRLHVGGSATMRGGKLLLFKGEAELDGQRLVDGEDWQRGKLDIDFDVPGYALSRLQDLQPRLHAIEGWLRGSGTLRGTWGAPDLKLAGQIDKLMLAGARFANVDGNARYEARRWRFAIGADAASGRGQLRASGAVARDDAAPLDVHVDANDLDVRFLAATWEQIGEIGGLLNAHVAIAGTRADPVPSGTLELSDGSFAFRRDPRHYQGALALRVDGDTATLTELNVRGADGGALTASGRAQLAGLKPTELSLEAKAHKFTVGMGSAAMQLDADFTLAGDRTDNRFHGRLDVHRGTIVLPKLPGGDSALPMGELADVSYRDARSEKSAMQRQTGQGAFIVAKIEGPLQLRGREADLDLVGELGVTVAGGALGLEGVVESTRGSVELLGHHYVVERGQLAFAGAANDPELHLRATRRIGAVTIVVIIEGTAQHPDVRLSSDPPVYDQTQLVSLVLAGRPNQDRVAVGELNRQITGLLSAVVIQKIEQQVAPTLPIDVVRPLDQQSYAELSQSPLEVGRFVTDRIYVSYEHRFGSRMGRSEANANEARAEYKLGSKGHWQLDTTFG
ncbi:MAG TPA: translocation/assembly module TamB domain-containing protein, partial [Polyangia bacterium]|nr:translocation/assembly module TamB domain-containing protein [Polyangia bacterium]